MRTTIVNLAICFLFFFTAVATATEECVVTEIARLSFCPPVFGDATGLYRLEIVVTSNSQTHAYSAIVIGKSHMLPEKTTNQRVVPLTFSEGESIELLAQYASFDLSRHRVLYPEADVTTLYDWSYVHYFCQGKNLTLIPPQPKGYDRLVVAAFLDNKEIRDAARCTVLEDMDRLPDERRYLEAFWMQVLTALK